MNVLLTGGAGYIGSHTAVELLNRGCDIVIADDYSNSSPVAVERLRQITGRDFPAYHVDVTDREAVRRIFRENKIDCVIHFAGKKAVGESVEIPLSYYRTNLDAALTVLECMKEASVSRFIFSSSATVYSGDNEMPLRETSRTGGCTNPYGWTKYMTEQILSGMSHADPEWNVVLLRYFNPIGAHESGLIGEDPRGIPNNLMPYITQVAIGRRECLSVYGNDYPTPDGTGVRDYIHVVDLAKGHVAAVKYVVGHPGCEVFNLGTGIGYSVLDMVHAFEKANNLTLPYKIVDRRPGDLPTCYADPTKSAQVLGWKAEKNLEDMCRDSWRWQTQNPMGYGD